MSDSKPALDRAFPSLFVMGLLLAVAIGLIAICSWKVLLLHQEEQDMGEERLLLDRDRDEFLTYGSELPQLKEEHRVNLEQVAILRERQQGLQEEIGELQQKRASLQMETETISGTIATLNGQVNALRQELGSMTVELQSLGPDLEARRRELEVLKSSEEALNESILQKRKDESALVATLAGLERSRQQATEFLARLEADSATYAKEQNSFAEIMKSFDAMLKRAGGLTGDYAAKLEDLAAFRATLERTTNTLNSDLQAMAANLEAIREDRASHAALLKQGTQQMTSLQAELDGVAATNKKFATIMESVQGLDKKLQDALTAETKNLARMAGEDAETRAVLSAAAASLSRSADNLAEAQKGSRENSTELGRLLAAHGTSLEKLSALAIEFEKHSDKSRENALNSIKSTASLAESAQQLQGQTQRLQGRLEFVESQGREMEKVLRNEEATLGELTRLGLEMRGEINASQRLGEEVRAALAEILALLRASKQSGQSGDSQ